MEPITENRYILTKALFFEGMAEASRATLGKITGRAVLALAAVLAALAVSTALFHLSPAFFVLEGALLILAALWLRVLLPRRRAGKAWKKLESQCHGEMERTTRFYFDRLIIDTSQRQVTVPYRHVEQVLESPRLLVLISRDHTGILVPRDGFIRGTAEETLALIRRVRDFQESHEI